MMEETRLGLRKITVGIESKMQMSLPDLLRFDVKLTLPESVKYEFWLTSRETPSLTHSSSDVRLAGLVGWT